MSWVDSCIFVLCLVASLIVGFFLGYESPEFSSSSQSELQEQVDTQQMRLDILIDELKRIDVGGQIAWDRL